MLRQKYYENLFLILGCLGGFWKGFTMSLCLSQGMNGKLTLLTIECESALLFNEKAARIMLLLLQ